MSSLSDYNDLARVAGGEAVAASIFAAVETDPKSEEKAMEDDSVRLLSPLAPPRMADAGFPPLLRHIVDTACNTSEAHPVAVAATAIAFFSCMLGRGVFQRIGDAVIHCRPFVLVVGKSGKARKGTSETTVREIMLRACSKLRDKMGTQDRLRVHAGGLSTGEGIGWAIRDAQEADENGKGGDLGVFDKRLMVIEPEFDNLLSQLRRDSNTLSATIRNLFDGRDIEPLTKTSRTRTTRPHVVIIGHVTGYELREKSTENDAANGLMNRFMMLYVYRPKLVPLPEPTPEARLVRLADEVAAAVMNTAGHDLHANNTRECTMSDEAKALWVKRYPRLTRDRDGKGGSLMARTEVYARMLAMIFAAMDGRLEIEPCDLQAALAWIDYWQDSVTYVFNCPDDEGGLDPFVAEVLRLIGAKPGVSLTELQKHFKGKKTKLVKSALETLLNMAPPLIERDTVRTTGRPAEKYFIYGKK